MDRGAVDHGEVEPFAGLKTYSLRPVLGGRGAEAVGAVGGLGGEFESGGVGLGGLAEHGGLNAKC